MRLLRPPHVEEGPWVCRRFLISSLTRHHRQRRCGSCGLPTACCLRASCRACCAPLLSGSRHRLEDIAPGAPATMHQKNKCNCWSQCDVRAAASCPALELRQRPLLLVSPARAVQSSDAKKKPLQPPAAAPALEQKIGARRGRFHMHQTEHRENLHSTNTPAIAILE